MIYDLLPTDLLISAQIRAAAQGGVIMVLRQRGDNNNGAVLIKISMGNGRARLLTQTRRDNEVMWLPTTQIDPDDESVVEEKITKLLRYDPDLWLVEVEDRNGQHWFPGKILKL